MSGISYKREKRKKHIRRRKRIASEVFCQDVYKHDGQYSKNKIHCSCKVCREKRRDGYVPQYEKRKAQDVKQQLEELKKL